MTRETIERPAMPRKSWEIPEREAISESQYLRPRITPGVPGSSIARRDFLRGVSAALGGMGFGGLLSACGYETAFEPNEEGATSMAADATVADIDWDRALYPAPANPAFGVPDDRPLTGERRAATYNNFYEFVRTKKVHEHVERMTTHPWFVEVTGLVENPRVYDIDELIRLVPLEERVYRHRCVEMVSFFDPVVARGQWERPDWPWAYTEGLTMAEATNELAFMVTGIYGHELPKQHGAPLRLVAPWKYGYKSIKSIVRINFTDTQPATFWNTVWPEAYPFESNVDPEVRHPSWPQKIEWLLDIVELRDTVKYNGYGEWVAHLYE